MSGGGVNDLALWVARDDVGDDGVGEVSGDEDGRAAVADDVGDGDVGHGVGEVLAIAVSALSEEDGGSRMEAVGRPVDDAVDEDVPDAGGVGGQEAYLAADAAAGIALDVADDDVMDVLVAAGEVAVHDMGAVVGAPCA